MPEYQQNIRIFGKHLEVMTQIEAKKKELKFEEMFSFEQELVTGLEEKNYDAFKDMTQYDTFSKTRLAIIAHLTGMPDEKVTPIFSNPNQKQIYFQIKKQVDKISQERLQGNMQNYKLDAFDKDAGKSFGSNYEPRCLKILKELQKETFWRGDNELSALFHREDVVNEKS